MITQQQALEALDVLDSSGISAISTAVVRQFIIEQGAQPGADVVMVPRKTAISARDHVPYLGETWRALNAAISAAPQPQQEQSNG